MQRRICIGKIVSVHGIKGLVKILPFCEDLSLLNGPVYTDEKHDDDNVIVITLQNRLGKYILAGIEGISDRNAAESLKCSLFVPREALPKTEENEYYTEDLIGLNAVENGETIGTVLAVANFGAGDLLDIELPNGRTFYLPFQENHIGDIDFKAGTVAVRDIEAFRP